MCPSPVFHSANQCVDKSVCRFHSKTNVYPSHVFHSVNQCVCQSFGFHSMHYCVCVSVVCFSVCPSALPNNYVTVTQHKHVTKSVAQRKNHGIMYVRPRKFCASVHLNSVRPSA